MITAPAYYKCVEVDDEPYQCWEISLVKETRTDYIDTIHVDDMGDWISHEIKTNGVIDIRLVTWDAYQQEQYERQEERRSEAP